MRHVRGHYRWDCLTRFICPSPLSIHDSQSTEFYRLPRDNPVLRTPSSHARWPRTHKRAESGLDHRMRTVAQMPRARGYLARILQIKYPINSSAVLHSSGRHPSGREPVMPARERTKSWRSLLEKSLPHDGLDYTDPGFHSPIRPAEQEGVGREVIAVLLRSSLRSAWSRGNRWHRQMDDRLRLPHWETSRRV